MNEPSFARVSVGDVLFGKYRVERVLGVGGMGIVVAARHTQLDALYALKLMHPAEIGNRQALARFFREARAAAKLRSEHVARVFDAGRTPRGIPYILLEYLEGCDLQQLGKKRECLPVVEAVLYVLHACTALVEAHAAGIIHRDLKPANLFLTHRPDGSPCVKVLDFGISKRCDARAPSGMTRTTDILGSPLYMSPEQMRSTRDVDARTDLWALGAILYRLLAGEAPFAARSLSDVYEGILEREPRPLSVRRPDVPPALDAVVRRCLRKKPDDRFPSALTLAAALAPFAPEEEAPRSLRKPSRASLPSTPAVRVLPAVPPMDPAPDDVPTSRDCRAAMNSAPTLRSVQEPTLPLSTSEPTGAAWGGTWSVSARAREHGSRVVAAAVLVAAVVGGGTGIWASREERIFAARARPASAAAEAAKVAPTNVTPLAEVLAGPAVPAESTKVPAPPVITGLARRADEAEAPSGDDARPRKKEPQKRAADPFGRSRK
ncbi:serine/threonine-protein kinase [Polyangium sorediatum]|uniref:Serine/threonine-protein kinase n=1 Tax=Polyangium sorediatum TaxID=889274 RepID=A0ABT6P2I8_9BACT|nr:serine/threonine-protein kinase [Polyangium sorediatum]MDI1434769.1 serine/threonine-protein kinase [Polyangium sorediatum]